MANLLKFQNLTINPPTMRQRVQASNCFLSGYLSWCLKHWDHLAKANTLRRIKDDLITYDVLVWTTGDQFQHFDLIDLALVKMNLAFLYILEEDPDNSLQWIESTHSTLQIVEKFIQAQPEPEPAHTFDVKHVDHLEGFKNVLTSLKVLRSIMLDQVPEVDNFVTNNPRMQAVEKILEARFIGEFQYPPSSAMELQLLNEAIDLDEHWEWFIIKYKTLRWSRRNRNARNVTIEEQNALSSAVEMNPDHPTCVVLGCELLAEILKERPRFPLSFHGRDFATRATVVDYLRSNAEQFEIQFASPSWMFKFSAIFSSVIGKDCDLEFALRLLGRGLNSAPDSSKLHHRKAIILSKQGKWTQADDHIRQAVSSGYRNKSALLDMAKLFLRHRDLNSVKDELHELFDHEYLQWSDDVGKPAAVIQLLFLKGYFYMRINNPSAAILYWLDWVKLKHQNQGTQGLFINFVGLPKVGLLRWGWTWQFVGNLYSEFIKSVNTALQNFMLDHPGQRQGDVQLLKNAIRMAPPRNVSRW